jgi:hypothetical protein
MTFPRPVAVLLVLLAASLGMPDVARARRAVTVRVPPFDVAPRQNREICTFVPLPTNKPLDIADIFIRNQGANVGFTSHHLIVYAYRAPLEPVAAAKNKIVDDTACLNFGTGDPTALQLLATSQALRSHQPMPESTALHVDLQSMGAGKPAIGLVLNSHWINSSDKVQRARAKIKIVSANPRKLKRQLKPIFEVVANAFLKVPPGETSVTGWRWGPGLQNLGGSFLGGVENPSGPACVTMLIGHMHRRGTLFTADFLDASGNRQRLYTNERYSDPPTLSLADHPLLVRNGETIEYNCTHDNATDPKLGCEEEPGVAPGVAVVETFPDSFYGRPAKQCHAEGPAPDECPPIDPKYPGRTFTGNCVKANLVFGFTSEDDMCILPGYYYDANPDAPPGSECDL